ncbi:MAG: phosphate ABC transporter permease PstA [Pseudomonadota bacterium]|nr:phosphate ABC transporter permease PstA [Pseudomonadota bacterium]
MENREQAVKRRLTRRHRASRWFRRISGLALLLAVAFLMFFFYDIISTGWSAFRQAEIQVPVSYTEEVMEIPAMAVPEAYEELVSRGWIRLLPRQMRENPDLLGTERREWVVASAPVDQYLKGRYATLDDEQRALVDQLQASDQVRLGFNTGFFTHGDSKIPEISGIWAALVGSILVITVTFLISFPIGVMTAIYLHEFADDNWFTQAIEVNINNLAAVPSIIFGLLGLAIFINFFGLPRSSALVGGLTLALMTLPIIIISTRAALAAVPDSIREAALGVGTSKWRMVRDHVLPLSLPGILTGTIIGIAQAMGETAPLLIVGMIAYIPDAPSSFTEATTVLPAQIFTWAGMPERAYTSRTAAGIIVLLAVLLTLNATAVYLRRRFERRW